MIIGMFLLTGRQAKGRRERKRERDRQTEKQKQKGEKDLAPLYCLETILHK